MVRFTVSSKWRSRSMGYHVHLSWCKATGRQTIALYRKREIYKVGIVSDTQKFCEVPRDLANSVCISSSTRVTN